MDDLISRAAVLSRFKALQEYDPEYEGRGWACNFLNDSREPSAEWYCIEDVVEDVPAVDAAPVVHGQWIEYPLCLGYAGTYSEDHIVCSNCKSVWNIIENDTECFDYCPHCGAKMDGERRGDDGKVD